MRPAAAHPRRGPGLPVAPGLLAAGIFLVALNLRAPITSVPPLVPTIERDLDLTGAQVGALTTLPVLCMGLFAPLAQGVAHRVGRETTVAGALVAIAVGTVLRLGGQNAWFLFVGAFVAGVGIAIGGTLLPGIVSEFFRDRSGLLTGLYMGGMVASAALASLLAVPLAVWLGSWPTALAAFSVLPVVGLVVWVPISHRIRRSREPHPEPLPRGSLPWRQATGWLVAIYLVVQSMQFYTQVAWIPATYEARGWSLAATGLLLGAFMVAQAVTGVGAPVFGDRFRDLRPLMALHVIVTGAGTAGVTLAPGAAPFLWVALVGLGLGGGFALGLVLLVRYAATPAASARLAGMAFLVSFGLASLGPTGFGALRDLTGSFQVPWIVLLSIAVIQIVLIVPLGPRRRRVV